MAEKFYLTTPIYYVNARPHIGHAYTTIVADVLARRHRLLGDDTYFLTGTDEHGQKIERSAAAAGVAPQQFADEVSASFKSLWDRMGLTYNQYIRTTDEAHKRGVQKLFTTLQEKGAIYLDSYTGQYCVSEEMFVEGPPGTIGPDGRPTETVTEENYFFKLSEYQQPLIELIESGGLTIEPEARRNEVLSFLRGGLRDLSISRSSFTWGIPVPGDEKHVIYVWLDALANYMTAVGYGDDSPEAQEKFSRYWPADLHIVGKEIIRFHCVYWPAFLLAAGLPLPKKVVAHGWLLFEDSKMSKSKGNIVRTETILDAFGTLCPPPSPHALSSSTPSLLSSPTPSTASSCTPSPLSSRSEAEGSAVASGTASPHDRDLFAADVLRYFLLREIPFGQDGSFSFDALITRYNADLANGYGNLVSRTLKMIETFCARTIPTDSGLSTQKLPLHAHRYFFGAISGAGKMAYENETTKEYLRLRYSAGNLEQAIDRHTGTCWFSQALEDVWWAVSGTDSYLSSAAPWKMPDSADRNTVLYTAAESIRIITALAHPYLPFATANVWRQLGLGDIEAAAANGELKDLIWGGLQPGTKLGPLSPIFPRADKGLAQIMIDMESSRSLTAVTDNNDAATPSTTEFGTGPVSSEAPKSKLVDESFVQAPPPTASFDPAAGPRTASFDEPNPGAQVAGSDARTTERTGTPSHTEAASGIFAAQSPADASPQITIDDFAKVELRVAKILVCERIPKADKLLRLEVDLGYEKRQILSGIAEWYTPEELVGRRIVVITNLAPRKMRGLESHGMLLAASTEGGKPHLATFADADDLPLGSRLK